MSISKAEIERLSKDIRTYFRQEMKSIMIQPIRPTFYSEVKKLLLDIDELSREYVNNNDLENLRQLMNKKDVIIKNLRNFLTKRYEKIMRDSLLELDSKLMSNLTDEEKYFITEMHQKIERHFDGVLRPGQEAPPDEKLTIQEETTDFEGEETQEQDVKEDYVLVMIKANDLSFSDRERDYYLYKNDFVFLPRASANIIIEKNHGKKIEF